MRSKRRYCTGGLVALFLSTGAPTYADAQTDRYPNKPIRMIVPFAPGGGSDLVARSLTTLLAAQLGQQIVIDNRGGAGGVVGAETAARAAGDGYTLLLAAIGTHALNPSLHRNLPYDPVKDFRAISLVALSPLLLVVNPSLPVQGIQDLVSLAKAKPKRLNYASGGTGSSPHFAAALFNMMAGLDITHIPYKGAGPALTDLIAGQVEMMFGSMPPTLPHVRSGRIRALAVSTKTRSSAAPGVPTVAESGVAGYDVSVWYGVVAPAQTPAAIVEKLSRSMNATLMSKELKEIFSREGMDPTPSSPQEFSRFIVAELEKYARLVKSGAIRAE